MTQFDVHRNPVPGARRAYPYVVVMQSPLADTGRSRIVAPLVPRSAIARATGPLIPSVTVAEKDYAVLVPSLTTIPADALGEAVASAASNRAELLTAVDLMFFGV
jgi:toxin CcdB